MKTPYKLFHLLSSLLFVCSIAHSGIPPKEEFDFLNRYKNASLVEDGLGLLNSTAALTLSTAMNTGLWYGICLTPVFVSSLARQFKMVGQEQEKLHNYKKDFCTKLAPVIATTDTVLAGNVSPWPLEKGWWQTVRFAGAGLFAFANYHQNNRVNMPFWILGYFSVEATARSLAGAVSTQYLRSQGISAINPLHYTYGEYTILSFISGLIVGSIAYETMIAKGFTPAKASFVYAIFASLTGTLLAMMSMSTLDLDNWLIAVVVAGAVAGAVARARARARAEVVAVDVAVAVAEAVAVVGAGAGAGVGVGGVAGAVALAGALAGAGAVAGAGAGAGALITPYSSTSSKIMTSAAIALPALVLALINSFSKYAVYGFPLEESLSETAWNPWKKIYAPLDYLATLLD